MINKNKIYKRLYKDYSKKYLDKIILSGVFSIIVAGSTSAIAWLLDPAIKKLFIEKDQSLIFFIPLLIIMIKLNKNKSLLLSNFFDDRKFNCYFIHLNSYTFRYYF